MAGMSLLSSGEQDQDQPELTVDRISSLPQHIHNIIYNKISLVDAVRMSLLAKAWRHKWVSIPDFFLDCHDLSKSLNTRDIRWDIVSNIVNKFLFRHTGPIRVFSLKAFCCPHYPDMYQWIKFLTQQNVDALVIQEYGLEKFLMPSHLFALESLRGLFLTGCSLQIPSWFTRYNNIGRLFLSDVAISDFALDYLIWACPILERLTLLNIWGLKNLRIRAPRLVWLRIDTGFETIVIGDAPFLVEVTINITDALSGPSWINLINCLRSLRSLLTLSLYGDLVKLLAADTGLEEFPLMSTTLRSLFLHGIRFENVEVFRVCLSLLCSCPNIRGFNFSIESAKGSKLITSFIKESRDRGLTFPELKSITITCLGRVGMGGTVQFIELIITEAPNLEFLTIIKEGPLDMNHTRLLQMLARFRRCRPLALVRYMYGGQFSDL